MIAPAYTMICTTNRNSEPRTRNSTARVNRFAIRNSAACTARRASTIAIAEATEIGATIQKTTVSATRYFPSWVPGAVPSGSGGSSSCHFS